METGRGPALLSLIIIFILFECGGKEVDGEFSVSHTRLFLTLISLCRSIGYTVEIIIRKQERNSVTIKIESCGYIAGILYIPHK